MYYKHNTINEVIMNDNLVQQHWDEVDSDRYTESLNIDQCKYKALEDSGNLEVYTAHEDDGEMVGYVVWLVVESPQSQQLQAMNDSIYVSPEYRELGIGRELMRLSEELLESNGVKSISITMKEDKRFEGLATALGYRLTELTYSKSVG